MVRTMFLSLAALGFFIVSPSLLAQATVPEKSTEAAKAGPIPLADFARPNLIAQPHLSPDGTALAGLVDTKGQQFIAMFNIHDRSDRPVYVMVPDDIQVAWISWVNNDNLLIGAHALMTLPGGDRWTIARLFGINRSSKVITKLLWNLNGQNAADVIWTAKDGSPNILVSAQNSILLTDEFWPAVWKVDVQTGKTNKVMKGRPLVLDWYADAAGNVRAGVSYDDRDRKFRLHYREGGSGSFKTVESANSKKQESLTAPFLFTPGTSRALAFHDNELGLSAIYEIDLLTQADLRTVFAAPDGAEVTNAIISSDGATLLGARYGGKRDGVTWFDPVLAEVQAAIDKSVPSRRAKIVSMSHDRSRLLVVVDRADTPGALYFFDIAAGKLQRISYQNEALGLKPLSPVKMIQYAARDGTQIEAVLTLPKDRPARNLPIVMLPHGGPWAHDTQDYDYWTQFLASRGYAVLQPNFRGSTGYGTAFLRAGEGQMGLAMQDDITDGLSWAVKEGIADPKRACIVGASYGGYAAMWGIAKNPELYRCAVSIAGVANLRREVNDFGDSYMGGKFHDDWKRMTPDFSAVSPIFAVARIKTPLLLVHGKLDIIVDHSQSAQMFGKMRGAGKTVELISLPEADHHFSRQADRVSLLTALENFLFKYNPPDPAPSVK